MFAAYRAHYSKASALAWLFPHIFLLHRGPGKMRILLDLFQLVAYPGWPKDNNIEASERSNILGAKVWFLPYNKLLADAGPAA